MDYKLKRLLTIFIILLGVAVRLFHYCYNRSLWMDEVYLSSSFLHYNYMELLTERLEYDQKAPIGFLWLVKLTTDAFGLSEFSLRAIPLIAGISSLLIFPKISKNFLTPTAQIIALFIFSFAPAFVYHSVEIKQYSMECLASLLALYLYLAYGNNLSVKQNFKWGVYGSLLLFFSFSVVFVLAGIAAALFINCIFRRTYVLLIRLAIPSVMWMVSFLTIHLCLTLRNSSSQWVVYFFKVYNNFMPFPPTTLEDLKWFPRNFLQMMDYPLGLAYPLIPTMLLCAGLVKLRTKVRRLLLLTLPILFTMVASGLYLYPLIERFWLFLTPFILLLIGTGFDYISRYIKSSIAKSIVLTLLLLSPLAESVHYLYKPEKFYKHKKSFERESLLLINRSYTSGDCVYNYWNNIPGYRLYNELYPLRYQAIEGQDMRRQSKDLADYNNNLAKQFKVFNGYKRLWVIYNNNFLTDIGDLIDDPKWYYSKKITPNDNLIIQIEKIGKPIKKFVFTDVTILLVELFQ